MPPLDIIVDRYGQISEALSVEYPGIYFVFVGKPRGEGDFLYIGKTQNTIRERIDIHIHQDEKKMKCWKRAANGELSNLYFASCRVEVEDDRKRIEAALIYKLQPMCNDDHRKKYNFKSVSIRLRSCYRDFHIQHEFYVEKNSERTPLGQICTC